MLVVIDPNQDDQPALRRAVYLHQRIGGRIKAFLPIYDFSYEMTTLLSPDERTAMRQGVIAQRTAWIREQAKFYLESGVPIDVKVVWHNRPFEAIIQEVISEKHDLLLKMAHQHDKLEAVIFTPTDWHLLRKCPCPVWMVKDQPWPEGGKALVAVNLASEENYHNTLNEKLVRETLSLAEEVNHTEVHLIGAYPVTPINIAIELPDFDPSVYNDAIRGQHLLAMKALRQKFGIDEKFTHVEKGLPEEVIPDLAEHLLELTHRLPDAAAHPRDHLHGVVQELTGQDGVIAVLGALGDLAVHGREDLLGPGHERAGLGVDESDLPFDAQCRLRR